MSIWTEFKRNDGVHVMVIVVLFRLSPAFQWAESGTHVFIQVKLAYRWSSPGNQILHRLYQLFFL